MIKRNGYRKIKNITFIIIILSGGIIFINRGDIINTTVDVINDNNYGNKFDKIYYYNNDNEQRYEEYKSKNTKLTDEDVVWMVNANLDNVFYSNINKISDTNSKLLLVNKYNKLPDDFVPKNLVKSSSGHYLTYDTNEAFERMKNDALKDGYTLGIASAYRSISSQNYLYNNYLNQDNQDVVDTYSARAGYSEHHTGEAIDLIGSFGSIDEFEQTKESKWVEENAYKYGFIIRYKKEYENITGYKYEPWHIRYIGVEASVDMMDKKIDTLEEYYEKYIVCINK